MTKSKTLPEARIIGIDCATDPKKVGLALGFIGDGRPRIEGVALGSSWAAIDDQLTRWATGPATASAPTLLAVDAPLGWPALLARSLHGHRAGLGFDAAANVLFRRSTDDAVAKRLGKRPLDVGSDRIARTAHAALSLLVRLRKRLGAPIPLAWAPGSIESVAAIEVYPAGTLAARGLPCSGYKGPADAASGLRQELVTAIEPELPFDAQARELMVHTDHALDAVLCVVAGLDFVTGDAVPPDDLSLAKQEGWIWVRR